MNGKPIKRFVTADTHFGHTNIVTFDHPKGGKLREFLTIEEHDEEITKQWNETVATEDMVYILGDAAFGRDAYKTFSRLNGTKILVQGNHDTIPMKEMVQYFEDVKGVMNRTILGRRVVLTHVPVHPLCLDRWDFNIHGHLHAHNIPDPRYYCVSLEHTEFRPVLLETVVKELMVRNPNAPTSFPQRLGAKSA